MERYRRAGRGEYRLAVPSRSRSRLCVWYFPSAGCAQRAEVTPPVWRAVRAGWTPLLPRRGGSQLCSSAEAKGDRLAPPPREPLQAARMAQAVGWGRDWPIHVADLRPPGGGGKERGGRRAEAPDSGLRACPTRQSARGKTQVFLLQERAARPCKLDLTGIASHQKWHTKGTHTSWDEPQPNSVR